MWPNELVHLELSLRLVMFVWYPAFDHQHLQPPELAHHFQLTGGGVTKPDRYPRL
jgi:hypothetical protein